MSRRGKVRPLWRSVLEQYLLAGTLFACACLTSFPAWAQAVPVSVCDRCGVDRNSCGCQPVPGHPPTAPCPVPCVPRIPERPRDVPTPRDVETPREFEEQYTTRETGFYQTPPPVGSVQAPTRSFGFGGGAIRFHEMVLRFPTIELPSVFRTRESARMRIAACDAPWVSTGMERVATGAAVQGRAGGELPRGPEPVEELPRDASRARVAEEECEQKKREYERKIDELNRKLQDCDELRKCIEDCLRTHPGLTSTRRPERGPLADPARDGNHPVYQLAPPLPPPDETRARPRPDLRPASYHTVLERDTLAQEAPEQLSVPAAIRRLPPPARIEAYHLPKPPPR